MGLRRFFKRVLPKHHEIREHNQLKILKDILHDPNIFHLTRRFTVRDVTTGLFFTFLPLPGQIFLSAIVAIIFLVNLPLTAVLVWITNPITLPLYLFIAHQTGADFLNEPVRQLTFKWSVKRFTWQLVGIWQPLLLGCLTFSIISALAGYFLIYLL